MRVRVLALAVAGGVLAQSSSAVAQGGMMMGQMMGQSPAMAHEQFTGTPPQLPTKHDRYVMRLMTLRDKTLKTKAKDGGELTPEHAAALQHELDELNKQFGVKGAG